MRMKYGFLISVFILLGAGTIYADPHAFPVPYVASRDGTDIKFTELPTEGTIKIFTIVGEKVASLSLPRGHADPFPWSVVNSDGKKLVTGVYLFIVEGSGQKTNGKIIVIR